MIEFRQVDLIDQWAIAFSKKSKNKTWQKICPGKYKHVSLFRYSAQSDTWVFIDLNFGGVDVVIGPGDTETIEAINEVMGEVDILTYPVLPGAPVTIRLLFTCVQFVKHAIGLRKPFILFPDQLFQFLSRNGAELWTVDTVVRRRPA